ncbi:hypothetical protein, partial [Streptomyces sp. NPDC054952]
MYTRPGRSLRRSRRPAFLTPAISAAVAVAVIAVGGPQSPPGPLDRTELAGNSYDWYDDTTAEQLRQDQCLMAEVLRLGGPAMAGTAQDGLNQPADKLRVLANRQHWQDTPLSQA